MGYRRACSAHQIGLEWNLGVCCRLRRDIHACLKDATRRHVVPRCVDSLDCNEAAVAVVERRELLAVDIAAEHDLVVAHRQARHLKFEVSLVRPEPRYGLTAGFSAQKRGRRSFRLRDRIGHRFEPDLAVSGVCADRAVACRDNASDARIAELIDYDPVFAGEPD